MIAHSPPGTEAELLARAHALAGRTLGSIARDFAYTIPDNLQRHKGWTGLLLEHALGATAGSRALPDFPDLGIELKTLPINPQGKPMESTYVCTVNLQRLGEPWGESWLRHKLARVLWLPILADKTQPATAHQVASALLWSPSATEEALLRSDWEELTECILLGELEQISARFGEVLQIRPKAASSRSLRDVVTADGGRIFINPRGFYLRPSFTHKILQQHFAL